MPPGRLRRFARGLGRELIELISPIDQKWSIGMYAGPAPHELRPVEAGPVLTRRDVTDRDADFVADPFMIRADGEWWMFFEVYVRSRGRGEIGVASSPDARNWSYRRIVLEEPFHLSYPQVFAWEGMYYMIPESYATRSVRLYRATGFPWLWECVATLLTGGVLLDPSLFRYDGLWWLLVETDPEQGYDTLRLFFSESLEHGWREHPASPVVAGDRRAARPGGRVVLWNGRPVRFAQDCEGGYGLRLRAFLIEELTGESYRERPLGVVLERGRDGDDLGWNRRGMHHTDSHPDGRGGWIACVDGWR
ncbi:glucosamine inositolphosphorylceramide transferase family protein [Rhizohabitans arisaemae]|uniref:glucosamine inositolphosphorylceramide transferase family protein n=1 Tax=Rhizohabitans arisaemae TaxID=2720610 RepID=UPI0024B0498F|nr:hypothetical protein [Rhizohabitans arisaemae]